MIFNPFLPQRKFCGDLARMVTGQSHFGKAGGSLSA